MTVTKSLTDVSRIVSNRLKAMKQSLHNYLIVDYVFRLSLLISSVTATALLALWPDSRVVAVVFCAISSLISGASVIFNTRATCEKLKTKITEMDGTLRRLRACDEENCDELVKQCLQAVSLGDMPEAIVATDLVSSTVQRTPHRDLAKEEEEENLRPVVQEFIEPALYINNSSSLLSPPPDPPDPNQQ